VYLAAEKQEGPKKQEKEYRTGEVRVVHDVLVDARKRV
jgi:hypothetical protein